MLAHQVLHPIALGHIISGHQHENQRYIERSKYVKLQMDLRARHITLKVLGTCFMFKELDGVGMVACQTIYNRVMRNNTMTLELKSMVLSHMQL